MSCLLDVNEVVKYKPNYVRERLTKQKKNGVVMMKNLKVIDEQNLELALKGFTDLSGYDLKNDLSGYDLKNMVAQNKTLKNVSFNDSNLNGANFSNTVLINCEFVGASLENVNFTGAKIKGCLFKDVDIIKGSFKGALLGSAFIKTRFEQCIMEKASIDKSSFVECVIFETSFKKSELLQPVFIYTNFNTVDFTKCKFLTPSFSDVEWYGLDFTNAKFKGETMIFTVNKSLHTKGLTIVSTYISDVGLCVYVPELDVYNFNLSTYKGNKELKEHFKTNGNEKEYKAMSKLFKQFSINNK